MFISVQGEEQFDEKSEEGMQPPPAQSAEISSEASESDRNEEPPFKRARI